MSEKASGLETQQNSIIEQQKTSLEKKESSFGFDVLEKDFEKNEAMSEFFDLVGEYVDFKLDGSFSDSEKNSIKLVILGEIQGKLKLITAIESVISNLMKPLRSLLNEWNRKASFGEKLKGSQEKLNEISDNFSNIFKKFGLEGSLEQIDKKIEQINKEKKDNKKEFKSLKDVFSLVNEGDNKNINDEQIYNDIKTQSVKLGKKFSTGKELGSDLIESVEGIKIFGFDLGGKVKDFLKDIANKFPIVGMFFSIIFGKEFLSESADKNKKATKNLKNYAKKKDFPLKNYIKGEDMEKLENDKLKEFYKFMDSKEIDVSKDDFWKELFTGNTKNNEIKNLNKLLRNESGNILEKNDNLDTLISKLNGLKKVDIEAKKKKIADDKAELEAEKKKLEETQKARDLEIQKVKQEQKTKEQEIQKAEQAKSDSEVAQKEAEQAKQKADNDLKQAQDSGKTEDELKELKDEADEKTRQLEEAKKLREAKEQAEKEAQAQAKAEAERLKKLEVEEKQAGIKKEKLKKKQEEIDFTNSIIDIGKNQKVIFEGKEYSINIEGKNILILGNQRYKMELLATEHDNMQILQEIKLGQDGIEMKYQSGLFSSDNYLPTVNILKNLFSIVIKKGVYNKKVENKPAILKIEKV